MSSFNNIGESFGGADTIPLNWTKPKINPIKVTDRTPIIIAPVTFLIARIEIIKKPNAASRVSELAKFPRLKNVASFWIV